MKRVLVVIGVVAQLLLSQSAYAVPFGDSVNYWTNWTSSIAGQDALDVIGQPDITGGDASVNTNHMLTRIDFTANTSGGDWTGLAPMDLFINVLNSGNDNNNWDFVVKTQGWEGARGGNFNLYDISGLNISAYRQNTSADDVYSLGYTRDGQPVGLYNSVVSNLTPYGLVGFDGLLANGFATAYDFNQLAGGGLYVSDSFIIGWGVTCANDVIYEQVPVPEPGTMMLLGMGMLGLAVYGKRRMNKNA